MVHTAKDVFRVQLTLFGMKKPLAICLCAFLGGCVTLATDRFTLQIFSEANGSLVLFNTHVDQYSTTWRMEAEEKAEIVFRSRFAQKIAPRESIRVLDVSLSEGGWATVFAAIGSEPYVRQCVTEGRLVAERRAARAADEVVKARISDVKR